MSTAAAGKYWGAKNPQFTPQSTNLPLHPGNNFHDDPVMRTSHRKSHHFGMHNNVPIDMVHIPPGYHPPQYVQMDGSTAAAAPLDDSMNGSTASARGERSRTPPWLKDDTVLRFDAFFKEPVQESPLETVRLRKCTIYFHTEDGTIMVREKFVPNSGMAHGVMIRRHKIPDVTDEGFVELKDLSVGGQVTLYAKTFQIVGCDANTRKYFEAEGVEVADNESYPGEEDHFTAHMDHKGKTEGRARKLLSEVDMDLKRHHEYGMTGRSTQPTVANVAAAQQFFNSDGKILTFSALWDDRTAHHGDVRILRLHYYLADDTIEILEPAVSNSGREQSAKFLVRQRLPKPHPSDRDPKGNRSVLDHINKGASQHNTYGVKLTGGFMTADDLTVGEIVRIHSRDLLLYECNAATRVYYEKQLGLNQPPDVPIDDYFRDMSVTATRRPRPPPHDGIGTEEDTLGNWQNLILKPARRDFTKWRAHNGKALKYVVRMVPGPRAPVQEFGRHFILTFYLEDDTLQLDEVCEPNSGIVGGRFLGRQKVKHPNAKGTLVPYSFEDFTPGAMVTIFSRHFEVLGQDERTERLAAGKELPKSIEELKELVVRFKSVVNLRYSRVTEAFRAIAGKSSGSIDVQELFDFLQALNFPVSKADVRTILNYYDTNQDGLLDLREFVTLMQGDEFSYNMDESSLSTKGIRLTEEHRMGDGDSHIDEAERRNAVTKASRSVIRKFRDRVYQRRVGMVEVYRLLNGVSPDTLLTPKELRHSVRHVLHLLLSEEEMDVLCELFFPEGAPYCSLQNFSNLMEGAGEFLRQE